MSDYKLSDEQIKQAAKEAYVDDYEDFKAGVRYGQAVSAAATEPLLARIASLEVELAGVRKDADAAKERAKFCMAATQDAQMLARHYADLYEKTIKARRQLPDVRQTKHRLALPPPSEKLE